MTDHSPFNHQPDPELGQLLREALHVPDDASFVRAVMERVPARIVRESWLDILGAWARPGLAAAAMLALVAGLWVGSHPLVTDIVSDEVAVDEIDPSTLLATHEVPQVDVNVILADEYGRLP